MPPLPKICIDRILPADLYRPHTLIPRSPGSDVQRAIALRNKQWPVGSTLTVGFIGGTESQRAAVKAIAPEWSKKCNIKFGFKESLPATIRVSFNPSDGAWSYIGTDALQIPSDSPTMNLGWIDKDVILHEFAHAISMLHEHQNPEGGIQWNEEQVIADLSGPPNFWDEETIRHNVLNKYSADQIHGTAFDSKSIMLYSFPAEWTTNGFSAPWNSEISQQDAAFAASEVMYPFAEVPPTGSSLPLFQAIQSDISGRGELDEYELIIPTKGTYIVETAGATDVVVSLYLGTRLMAANDDGGVGSNARIAMTLNPGTYRVTVKHYSALRTGPYRIIAWT